MRSFEVPLFASRSAIALLASSNDSRLKILSRNVLLMRDLSELLNCSDFHFFVVHILYAVLCIIAPIRQRRKIFFARLFTAGAIFFSDSHGSFQGFAIPIPKPQYQYLGGHYQYQYQNLEGFSIPIPILFFSKPLLKVSYQYSIFEVHVW